MTSDQEDRHRPFLERWSRRKLDETPIESHGPEQPAPAAETAEEDEEVRLDLQKNREAAEAIDLESLDADSDYSPFFRQGVPKLLKLAALQTLWRSSPVFANLDGLNDYDHNYADPALIKKFTGTAWKIGKGYLSEEPDIAEIEDGATGDAVADASGTQGSAGTAEEAAEQAAEDDGPDAGDEAEAAVSEPLPQDTGEDPPQGHTDEDFAAPEQPEPEKVRLRARLSLDDWETG